MPNYPHKHAWHLFQPLINKNKAQLNRNGFMAAMKEANIGTGLHYQAAHVFKYYQDTCGFKPGDFPYALDVGNRIVSLPLFPDLSEKGQDRVLNVMETVLKKG